MRFEDVQTETDLYGFVLDEIGGLPEDTLGQAFRLRDWASANATFALHRDLILKHTRVDVTEAFQALRSKKLGVWCGGAATFFSQILSVFNVPHTLYGYFYEHADLSHLTTAVCDYSGGKRRYYIIDAYLRYHYEQNGEILALADLLRLVSEKRYDEIKVVTLPVSRHAISLPNDTTEHYWSFPDGRPAPIEKRDDVWVYADAHPDLEGLLAETSPFRTQMDEYRGNIPPQHFLLEMLRHNVYFTERIGDVGAKLKLRSLTRYLRGSVIWH